MKPGLPLLVCVTVLYRESHAIPLCLTASSRWSVLSSFPLMSSAPVSSLPPSQCSLWLYPSFSIFSPRSMSAVSSAVTSLQDFLSYTTCSPSFPSPSYAVLQSIVTNKFFSLFSSSSSMTSVSTSFSSSVLLPSPPILLFIIFIIFSGITSCCDTHTVTHMLQQTNVILFMNMAAIKPCQALCEAFGGDTINSHVSSSGHFSAACLLLLLSYYSNNQGEQRHL